MFWNRTLHIYIYIYIYIYLCMKSYFPKHYLQTWHLHCKLLFFNVAYCVWEKNSSYTPNIAYFCHGSPGASKPYLSSSWRWKASNVIHLAKSRNRISCILEMESHRNGPHPYIGCRRHAKLSRDVTSLNTLMSFGLTSANAGVTMSWSLLPMDTQIYL